MMTITGISGVDATRMPSGSERVFGKDYEMPLGTWREIARYMMRLVVMMRDIVADGGGITMVVVGATRGIPA